LTICLMLSLSFFLFSPWINSFLTANGRHMNCCPKGFDSMSAPCHHERSCSRDNSHPNNCGHTTWTCRIRTLNASWLLSMHDSPPIPSPTGTGHSRCVYWHTM
jgi:hypothetical protein